jgi:hypothetical protein
MGIMRLRVELRAVRHAINELRSAIENHSEAIHATEKASDETQKEPKTIPVLVSYDEQINTGQNRQNTTQDKIAFWTRGAVIAAIIYATIAALQWCEMHRQLSDFEDAQAAQLIIVDSEKAFHTSGDRYSMDITLKIKNVGATVAREIGIGNSNGVITSSQTRPNGPSLGNSDIMESPTFHQDGSVRLLPGEDGGYMTKMYFVLAYRDIFNRVSQVHDCIAYRSWKDDPYKWIHCDPSR